MPWPPRVKCECTQVSFANHKFRYCGKCDNRRREPYTVDLRGKSFPDNVSELPPDFDFKYDNILTDPPDKRSPMIRMLDDEKWRRSLVEAATEDLGSFNVYDAYDLGPFEDCTCHVCRMARGGR